MMMLNRCRWISYVVATVAGTTCLQGFAANNGEVPAILHFAEKYQGDNVPAAAPTQTPKLAHSNEREKLTQQIAQLKQQLSDQSKKMSTLQARVAEPFDDSALNDARKRQDYAAGVSLGEEINQLQAEHARWGIESDKKMLLAGISDSLEKRVRLPQEKLVESLKEVNQQIDQKRSAAMQTEQNKTDAFLAEFKQRAGAEQLENGLWQHIEHVGDDAIADNDIVDVVIRETLADGEVVQDMELHNKVLSQPRQAFPAIFRDALSQLRNHGSMTIVVPAELAYGDAGYPPLVPPGATMIYHLRIADAHAASEQNNHAAENAL
jgi:FKBP-type peptidyl-prolyl cis-trans isomerase FkpA